MTTKVEGSTPKIADAPSTTASTDIPDVQPKGPKARPMSGFEMANPSQNLATAPAASVGAPGIGNVPVATKTFTSKADFQMFVTTVLGSHASSIRRNNPSFGGRVEIKVTRDPITNRCQVIDIKLADSFTGSASEKEAFISNAKTTLNNRLLFISVDIDKAETQINWSTSLIP